MPCFSWKSRNWDTIWRDLVHVITCYRSLSQFNSTVHQINKNMFSIQFLQDGVSVFGGAIGAMHIPEKWFPGSLDYYLNSHNIMHILVVVAVYSMHQVRYLNFIDQRILRISERLQHSETSVIINCPNSPPYLSNGKVCCRNKVAKFSNPPGAQFIDPWVVQLNSLCFSQPHSFALKVEKKFFRVSPTNGANNWGFLPQLFQKCRLWEVGGISHGTE